MQTYFSQAQLADSAILDAEKNLRSCVHCGFCTATCPTYILLGDELDSPRGRIYLIKDFLENNRVPTEKVVKHIDRCLSCLSCMTTCPSGVNYMHLIDQARHYIEKNYRRPLVDRLIRSLLALILPRPGLFRAALLANKLAKPFVGLLPARFRAMVNLGPEVIPAASTLVRPGVFSSEGARIKRVALLTGCAQTVLAPEINEATIRLLKRHGCEIVVPGDQGCCGALTHHLGKDSTAFARANIDSWIAEINGEGLDAIVINASGCGTMAKDYGFMFRDDVDYRDKAAQVSAITRDITEIMADIGLRQNVVVTGQRVAYHSACSMQHGQKITQQPKQLLIAAGFDVVDVPEGHLCCGSAGTYNMLQPVIAGQLRDRKIGNIKRTKPDMIATGNLGCATQIASGTELPVFHTVELLDWATGGPLPQRMKLVNCLKQELP